MNDCIFCSIIDGEVPGNIVYETDELIAFLDTNPVSKGHTLVVPKEHVKNIHGTEEMEFMWNGLVEISDAIEEAFDPEGINIAQNNGKAAGQEVMHLHFHVTPIYEGGELDITYDRDKLDNGEKIASQISDKIN